MALPRKSYQAHCAGVSCISVTTPKVTSRPDERWMYVSMRKELDWPHVAKNIYTAILNWNSCAQKWANGRKRRQVKLFSSDGLLLYLSMDISGPLSRKIKEINLLSSWRNNKLNWGRLYRRHDKWDINRLYNVRALDGQFWYPMKITHWKRLSVCVEALFGCMQSTRDE